MTIFTRTLDKTNNLLYNVESLGIQVNGGSQGPITPLKRVMIKILLVEDDPTVIRLFQRKLEKMEVDAELVTVTTERDAIEIANSGAQFDWVLLDNKLRPGKGENVYPHLKVPRERILGISSDAQPYVQLHFPKPDALLAIDHIVAAEQR
jgi:CheY-like chemotaxis protein